MSGRADPLFKLRLPDHLRQALEKEAAANRRSLTAEILGRLEMSLTDMAERLSALENEVFGEDLRGRIRTVEVLVEGGDPYNRPD